MARRVWKAIDEMGYYPNTQARALVSGRSRLLGLIVSDITNPFFPEIIHWFERLAVEQGFEVLLSSTGYDPVRMAGCLRRMLERRVEGVAVMTSEMTEDLISQLADRKVPLVLLDTGMGLPGTCNIRVDYEHGIQQGVQHLLGLGHRRIAFISGPLNLKSARVRREAFLNCLAQSNVSAPESYVVEGTHTEEGGLHAITHLLSLPTPPTGVLASNDLTAVGVLL